MNKKYNTTFYIIIGVAILLIITVMFFWKRSFFDFSSPVDDNLLGNFATFSMFVVASIALYYTGKDYLKRSVEKRPYLILIDKYFISEDSRKHDVFKGSFYEVPSFYDKEGKSIRPYVGIYNAGLTNAINVEIKWSFDYDKVQQLLVAEDYDVDDYVEESNVFSLGWLVPDRECFLFLPEYFMRQYGERLNNEFLDDKGEVKDKDKGKEKLLLELIYSDLNNTKYSQEFEFKITSKFKKDVNVKVVEMTNN